MLEGMLTGKDDDDGIMALKEFFTDFCLDGQMFVWIYSGIKHYHFPSEQFIKFSLTN